MYAVVKISGKQWKVETQNRIFVDKLPFKKDEIVPLDQVLLIRQENKITIGTPFVDKAIVQAKVLEQTRDKKIVVFKKKRRKGYKKKQGHRQYKTTLLIEKILVDGKALVEDTKKNKEVTATKTSNKKVSPKKQTAKQAKQAAKQTAKQPAKQTATENKTKTAKADSNKIASPKEQAAKQTSKNLEAKKSAGLKSKEVK